MFCFLVIPLLTVAEVEQKLQQRFKLKKNLIVLELGDEITPFKKTSKANLWVENQELLSASLIGSNYQIKGLRVGRSQIKLGSETLSVYVVPPHYRSALSYWLINDSQFSYLKLELCEQFFCLKGALTNFQQYLDLQKLFKKENVALFTEFLASDKIKAEILKWQNKQFEQNQVQSPQILLNTEPWKVNFSSHQESYLTRSLAYEMGLLTSPLKSTFEKQSNLKVSLKFIEVKKSLLRELGIQWADQYPLKDELLAKIIASESHGDSKTIAEPHIVCRNGHEGEFLAGGEIPIKISNFKTADIVWKKYGIQFKIKPLISNSQQVSLNIMAEISTPDFGHAVDGIPALITNKITTQYDLNEAKTFLISGLVRHDEAKYASGLPYLQQIPLLGNLFKSQGFTNQQTELLVFITPEVIN